MKILIMISTALMLLLSTACSGPAAYSPSASWKPVTVGNWWLYDVSGAYIEEGDTTHYAYTTEIRITGITEHLDGFELYVERHISNFNEPNADTSHTYIRQVDNEIRAYSDILGSFYSIELDLPLEIGKIWSYSDSLIVGQREVTDLDRTQSTPAGTFYNCAVMTEITPIEVYNSEVTYSKGCGLVHKTYSFDLSSETTTLQSYNVQDTKHLSY